jgi:hypothetical protein
MAAKQYVLVGNVQQGMRSGKVVIDNDRTAVLNGAPVALSDEEYERLSKRYVFREDGEAVERGAAGADIPAAPADEAPEAPDDNPEDMTE